MSMQVLFGAEWNSAKEPDGTDGSVVISGTYKRGGDYSWQTYNGQGFWFAIPDKDELYIQYALYVSNYYTPNNKHFRVMRNGASEIIICTDFDGERHLCVWMGNRATKIITSSTIFQLGAWYVVELHIKVADSGGVVELRVDGVPEGIYSGDTKPGTASAIDRVQWYLDPGVGMQCYVDDVIVNDISDSVNNFWPNGLKVKLLKPTADGPTNEWDVTPSGSHYAAIDEVPPSGADYIKTSTADEKEHFDVENLPAEALTVKAVQVQAFCLKGAFLDPDRLKLGVRIDNTDYLSDPIDLPVSSLIRKYSLDQNPAGGSWTVDAVNNARLALQAVN
ncbi:MAG: hypothetical protein ACOZF2_06205 [Thermodesulfobacteriota bacterium]